MRKFAGIMLIFLAIFALTHCGIRLLLDSLTQVLSSFAILKSIFSRPNAMVFALMVACAFCK